jgi:hypothetical protein
MAGKTLARRSLEPRVPAVANLDAEGWELIA